MLAGPRKKQKISADPRNKQWVDDSNKFGLRLMQKMGWSHGKGLGANMDGETENVKVVMKADSKGLGFSNKEEDNWIAHQDDFNDILSQLHQEHSDGPGETSAITPKSIEQRSKSSKRRVHYKKFTQGKDLAHRSVDDMNCILGKRSGSSTPHSISAPTSDNEDDKPAKLSHGVRTTVNSISLQDYFAQKMSQKKKNLEVMNGDCLEGKSLSPGEPPEVDNGQEGISQPNEVSGDDQVEYDEKTVKRSERATGVENGNVGGSLDDHQIVDLGGSGDSSNSVGGMVDPPGVELAVLDTVRCQDDGDVELLNRRKKKKRKRRDVQQGMEEGGGLDMSNGLTGSSPLNGIVGQEEALDGRVDGGTKVEIEEHEIVKKKRKKSKKKRQEC